MSTRHLPISLEDKSWIDDNLQELLAEFGVKRFQQMPMRLIHSGFFPEIFGQYN